MALFKLAVSNILNQENYSNYSKEDITGISNYGISLRFMKTIDANYSENELKALTKEEAENIYFQYFWLQNNYQEIELQSIANKVFDTAVALGSKLGNTFLQEAINFYGGGLAIDGELKTDDIKTLNNICQHHEEGVLFIYRLLQKEYYTKILANRPEKINFLKKWIERASY